MTRSEKRRIRLKPLLWLTVTIVVLVMLTAFILGAEPRPETIEDTREASSSELNIEDATYEEPKYQHLEHQDYHGPIYGPMPPLLIEVNNGDYSEIVAELEVPPESNYPPEPVFVIPDRIVIDGLPIETWQHENICQFLTWWTDRGISLKVACGLAGNWGTEVSFRIWPQDANSPYRGMWQVLLLYNGQTTVLWQILSMHYGEDMDSQNQFIFDILSGRWDDLLTPVFPWDNIPELLSDLEAAPSAAEVARIFNARFEKGASTTRRASWAEQLYAQVAPHPQD
ncbi:hypothetical protein FWH09_01665 [Candidatus Saccharibacteria bacterium]|nr:hypothetical protein [Candidatus Saccharibacteria bacterium]